MIVLKPTLCILIAVFWIGLVLDSPEAYASSCILYSNDEFGGRKWKIRKGKTLFNLPGGIGGVSSLKTSGSAEVDPYKSHNCRRQQLQAYSGKWKRLLYDHNDAFRCVICREKEATSVAIKQVEIQSAFNPDTARTTTSKLKDIPGMKLDFQSREGFLLISFSAECLSEDNNGNSVAAVMVQFQVNDEIVGPPDGINFCSSSVEHLVADARSINYHYELFESDSVNVRARFKSMEDGDLSLLFQSNLIVQYQK